MEITELNWIPNRIKTAQFRATHVKILHADQSRCDAMFNYCSTLGRDLKTNRNILIYVGKKSTAASVASANFHLKNH